MQRNGAPTVIDPLSDARWDEFVLHNPYGTVYQHSSWLRAIRASYRHLTPRALTLEDGAGNIRAAIPFCVVKSRLTGTRIVSLPFTSHCDPLVCERADFDRLIGAMVRMLEEVAGSYYELRVFRNLAVCGDSLKIHLYHKIHVLKLQDDFERLRKGFHKDCIRKSVRKAMRSGLVVREGDSERDLESFYRIHAKTRVKLGLPIQPYAFFKNMWDIMRPGGLLTLLLAELDRATAGGLIIFKFKDTVSLEHIGTSYAHLLLRPNHLLYYSAIEQACAEGYGQVDFGKTPPENQGLLDFKRRWGAEMHEVPYLYHPDIHGMMSLEEKDPKRRFFLFVGKHMPVPVARVLGRLVYCHLG